MTLAYTRLTILQIVNEVRRKLGLSVATTLTQDSFAINSIDYLNDVLAEVNDYDDWQEMLVECTTTASTSVINYLVNTTAAVENIHEIAFEGEVAPMRLRTLDDIRRLQRTDSSGIPTHFAIVGVDNSISGNPYFRVFPTPGAQENNQTFNILFYKKPRIYTTDDAAVIPEFPSRLLVQGLLAKCLLDESRGTPGQDYTFAYNNFLEMLSDTYNRFNGDTGGDTLFRPPYSKRRG